MKIGIVLLMSMGLWANASLADDMSNAWQQMKAQDFIIYYRSSVPEDFVQTTVDTAADEWGRIKSNLGITSQQNWSEGKQIKIYIYSDGEDYVKSGGQAGWSHGAAFAAARTIKTFPEASGFFDTILPHELGHIVFRDYIGLTTEVPLWFEEGVAIYQEKAKRLGSNKLVQETIQNGQFIPLSDLTGMRLYKDSKSQVVDVFYAESASVVNYMITQLGDQEFYFLCTELKNKTPFQEALHKVYLRFKTIDELNQTWVDYIQG